MEKLITKIEFDLSRGTDVRTVKGKASFYPDRIEVDVGGSAETFPTEGIRSYLCRRGVGCVSLEAEREDGSSFLICRGSMLFSDWFTLAAKRLNRYLTTGVIGEDFCDYVRPVCEKCGTQHKDNFWGKIVCFFRRIINFFKNLFN